MRDYKISVIIPTFNRAQLLRSSLESLTNQTIDRKDFEVVVVNDGSIDETPAICEEFLEKLNLKYVSIKNSGISAAKNMGIFIAVAPVLFFFDDDDVADPNLLKEHLKFHEIYPDEAVAVLGRTIWAPSLNVTEIMWFASDVGCVLFSYPRISENAFHDFDVFWGGRLSCKRSFLTSKGIFNQKFRFGYEDIELGHRLSMFDLRVVYNKNALQFMNREITLDDLCLRKKKQGAAKFILSQINADPVIQEYCQMQDADRRLAKLSKDLHSKLALRTKLEAEMLASKRKKIIQELRVELHQCYWHILRTYELEGFVEAQSSQLSSLKRLPIRLRAISVKLRGYLETRHH